MGPSTTRGSSDVTADATVGATRHDRLVTALVATATPRRRDGDLPGVGTSRHPACDRDGASRSTRVEPVDDLRDSNPPSNPGLWAALVREFVAKKFDRKHLMRVILNSRTYQLSSTTKPANEKDQRFYSHYYARRLPSERETVTIGRRPGGSSSRTETSRSP